MKTTMPIVEGATEPLIPEEADNGPQFNFDV
jgi:hypothetical protein